MSQDQTLSFVEKVIENIPQDWLRLTTHRLDIYEEEFAKTQFLSLFDELFERKEADTKALSQLPTAYDYIRLGHPLSCVLEWAIAKWHHVNPENVISFQSQTAPLLAILRTNHLEGRRTRIFYEGDLPENFDPGIVRSIYGFSFELTRASELPAYDFDGSTIFLRKNQKIHEFDQSLAVDFQINTDRQQGSVVLINAEQADHHVAEIQHFRRRETIAMTPHNTLIALRRMVGKEVADSNSDDLKANQSVVLNAVRKITGTETRALIGSSGLSVQYAIIMGLVHDAIENHPGKPVKIIVPPNCYGGTNDQARRVAACSDNIEVMDLHVDAGRDMVSSVDSILEVVARQDGVPLIIVEIPTNPRVEVPDLEMLREALTRDRKTPEGNQAVDPIFILDQTFCPNVQFLGEGKLLSEVRGIAYVSGSKFPSGGKCTAGYWVANQKAAYLMEKMEAHLQLCDNEATELQMEFLAEQLPSMNQRIHSAYKMTRDFVNFIGEKLPEAKINFVSEELAAQGFTPSVFSLDLPAKGESFAEREAKKRALNLKLIHMMIEEISDESKFCVSYGQLKGCYWTVPATSTQGTTKEGDKDYIVRAALSGNMNLDRHKEVFVKFVDGLD